MFTQVRVRCQSRVTFREKSRLCESKADATENKKIKTDKELRRPSGKAYFGAGNRTTVTGQYFPPISRNQERSHCPRYICPGYQRNIGNLSAGKIGESDGAKAFRQVNRSEVLSKGKGGGRKRTLYIFVIFFI